jgi:hypothetical protein
MHSLTQHKPWPAILVLAALVLGSFAPFAEADDKGRGKGKRKSRDRDQRVESRWRGSDNGRSRSSDVGSRRVRDHWVDRAFNDRRYRGRDAGTRVDSRWRGSRGGDVYVEQRVVRREARPVYRSRTVYRDVYRPSYRSSYRHRSPYATYTVWRRSNSGAVFAGFVGGLFLGATLANAAPAGFAYYDPYCHDTFATLGAYYSHCGVHRHTRTVHVIEIAAGYGYNDYHYCGGCEEHYWGASHSCGHDSYDDYEYDDD